MSTPLELSIKLSDEITNFPLGKCGPSDDPDMQYAYTCSFRDLVIRFVSAIKRIGDPDLSEQQSLVMWWSSLVVALRLFLNA